MDYNLAPFKHEFKSPRIIFGRRCVSKLSAELESQGLNRCLIVCGSSVGSNPRTMEPIKEGLGDKLIYIFDETSPKKDVETVIEGVETMREHDIDVLVSVGGGSSLDTAHVMSALFAEGPPIQDLFSQYDEDGEIVTADITGRVPPHYAIPTTLAGADLSAGGGVKNTQRSNGGDWVYGSVTNPKLMPHGVLYDPLVFASTPRSILLGSSMNGFNKGIEMIYSRNANPITDASATHGLRLLRPALPHLADTEISDEQMDQIVAGIILVQYGLLPREDMKKHSIIHAFGHGISHHCPVQQGIVHAIMTPHVLRYVFDNVYARRDMLAKSLGIGIENRDDPTIAKKIVEDVTVLRDSLELPKQLRTVNGLTQNDLPHIASEIVEDRSMKNTPPDFKTTQSDIEDLLHRAW